MDPFTIIALIVTTMISAAMSASAAAQQRRAQEQRNREIQKQNEERIRRQKEGVELDALEGEKAREAIRRRVADKKENDGRSAISILTDSGPERADLQVQGETAS